MEYQATYIVQNRILSMSIAPAALLSSYVDRQTFIEITNNNQTSYLDLSRMLLLLPNIDLTQTVSAFLTAVATDLIIEGFSSTSFPALDLTSQKYQNRLVAEDALSALDITIDYTSLTDPTVRNVPNLRPVLNDLALSSPSRDFSNALVTVNGVFHQTKLFEGQLFVTNGFKNIRNNEPNGKRIGIYDTGSLGGHIVYQLALNQVINTTAQDPRQGIYLKIPGANFLGSTVLLSFGGYLYALDDCYDVVGVDRIKLNTCKMDIINQFLHNPNTIYRNQYGPLAFNKALYNQDTIDPPDPAPQPSAQQEIVYFLTALLPTVTPAQIQNAEALLVQYKFTDLYSFISEIIDTLSYDDLNSAAFFYKILADPSSFLIVINNPNIYVRHYPLVPLMNPDQYQITSADTPRGLLRYDHNKVFPYTILSGNTDNEHVVSIDFLKIFGDAYKSVVKPTRVLSPYFDIKDRRERYPVDLLEIYAA